MWLIVKPERFDSTLGLAVLRLTVFHRILKVLRAAKLYFDGFYKKTVLRVRF